MAHIVPVFFFEFENIGADLTISMRILFTLILQTFGSATFHAHDTSSTWFRPLDYVPIYIYHFNLCVCALATWADWTSRLINLSSICVTGLAIVFSERIFARSNVVKPALLCTCGAVSLLAATRVMLREWLGWKLLS